MPRHKQSVREMLGGRPPKRSRVGKTKEPTTFKVRKTRKYRPGTVALREIRKHQTSTDLLIPKLVFQRLVKEVIQVECRDRDIQMKKIQSPALLVLQCACEDYVTELFSKSQRAAVHGKRITVTPDDFQLVMEFRGDYYRFHKPNERNYNRFHKPNESFMKELRFKRFLEQMRKESEELQKRKDGKVPDTPSRTFTGNTTPPPLS